MANKIPVRTLKRMPLYLNYLEDLSINGVEYISAPKIASDLNYNEVSVKKDLSYITSKNGRPKIGHYVNDLICDLKEIIGYNINKKACLVGCGNLGKALLKFKGFKKYGFEIVYAFDIDKDLIGNIVNGVSIKNINEMKESLKEAEIPIGIIAVCEEQAQSVCNMLVENGIKAIWNFAPVLLKVPKDIIVQNENMASSLSVLSNKINVR